MVSLSLPLLLLPLSSLPHACTRRSRISFKCLMNCGQILNSGEWPWTRMPTLITHRYPSCGRCCGLRLATGWVCMCCKMSHCGLELHARVGVPPTISIPFWFSLEFQLTLPVRSCADLLPQPPPPSPPSPRKSIRILWTAWGVSFEGYICVLYC